MSNADIVIIKGSWTPVTPGKSIPCIIYKNTDESKYLLLFNEEDAIKGSAYYVLQHNNFTFTVYTNQRYLGLKLTKTKYDNFIKDILDRKKEYCDGYWDSNNLIPNHFIKEIENEATKTYNNGAYNFLLGGKRRKRTIKRKRRSTRRYAA